MVIGGEDVFREVLQQAGRIYLTEVHATPEADTWFPALDGREWREVSREEARAGPQGRPRFQLCRAGTCSSLILRRTFRLALRLTGDLAYNPPNSAAGPFSVCCSLAPWPAQPFSQISGTSNAYALEQSEAEAAVGKAAAGGPGVRVPAPPASSLTSKRSCAAARTAFARPYRAGA